MSTTVKRKVDSVESFTLVKRSATPSTYDNIQHELDQLKTFAAFSKIRNSSNKKLKTAKASPIYSFDLHFVVDKIYCPTNSIASHPNSDNTRLKLPVMLLSSREMLLKQLTTPENSTNKDIPITLAALLFANDSNDHKTTDLILESFVCINHLDTCNHSDNVTVFANAESGFSTNRCCACIKDHINRSQDLTKNGEAQTYIQDAKLAGFDLSGHKDDIFLSVFSLDLQNVFANKSVVSKITVQLMTDKTSKNYPRFDIILSVPKSNRWETEAQEHMHFLSKHFFDCLRSNNICTATVIATCSKTRLDKILN